MMVLVVVVGGGGSDGVVVVAAAAAAAGGSSGKSPKQFITIIPVRRKYGGLTVHIPYLVHFTLTSSSVSLSHCCYPVIAVHEV
jgi:hypothetical protein